MKRTTSLLLTLVLLMLAMTTALGETQLPISETPLTYTAMLGTQNDAMPDPNTMPYLVDVFERTGVTLDIETVPTAAIKERLATTFASSELPDAFINIVTDAEKLTYGSAGALLPVDEYLDYMPNFKRILEENPNVAAAVTMPDGHIYSIPQINYYSTWPGGGKHAASSVWINKTWLEQLGLEIPKTTDEFVEVMKAFKEKDPNGNGIADEIPLSYCYAGGVENSSSFMYGPFGIIGQGENKNVKDGKVFYAIQDERYVEAIKWANQLYTAGLIDPEAFTQDTGRYYSKGKDETMLYGCFIDWDGATVAGTERTMGENADYVALTPLIGPNGDQLWNNGPAGVNANYVVLSSTSENPEQLCAFFDFLYEPDESIQVLWGKFGMTTDKDGEGWVQYTLDNYDEYGSATLYIMQTTPRVINAYIDDEMVQKFTTLNKDSGVKSKKTDQNKYIISEVYGPYCVEEFYPNAILTEEENETVAIISTPIINAIKEKEIAWIMGQGDVEAEWESFNKELDALGIGTMVDVYQAALDRTKE